MDIGFFLFIILKEALTFTLISSQLSTGLRWGFWIFYFLY